MKLKIKSKVSVPEDPGGRTMNMVSKNALGTEERAASDGGQALLSFFLSVLSISLFFLSVCYLFYS